MGSPGYPAPPQLDAGWYPDPTARYEARYWDGRRWTGHISHYGAQGTDPIRRARLESRIGSGFVVAMKAIVGIGSLAVIAWGVWKYWPRDEGRDVEAIRTELAAVAPSPADLGGTWTSGGTQDVGVLREATLPAECAPELIELHAALLGEPRSTSGLVDTSSGMQVVSTIVEVDGSDRAGDLLERLADPGAASCLEGVLTQGLTGGTAGAEVSNVDARLTPPPDAADASVSWRLTGRLAGSALPVDFELDLVTIRAGDRVAEVAFLALASGIDPLVSRTTIAALVARLEPTEAADGVDAGTTELTPADTTTATEAPPS